MKQLVVRVQQGQLRGVWASSYVRRQFIAFRGIPYAKPPVGNLRFKDPEPIEPWSGIRDASEFGNRSPHIHPFLDQIVGNEDCLYLNIYTRDIYTPTKRPVMFWIHGGAFFVGSGEDDVFGPDYLIERDIVLVTINYRLGVLGFLNVNDEEAPGNQGLKDQVLALKWVQQNISSFGGDPHNVTIFGESAGAASVHYLTISPLAQGLFHKAIMQSGVAINPWATPADPPEETARQLASVLGKETSNSKELVKFLRTIEFNRILDAEKELATLKNLFVVSILFGPTVDITSKNPFLTVPIEKAVEAGIRVPCILGYTSDEGHIFVDGLKDHFAELNADLENSLLNPNIKKWFKEKNISVEDVKNFFIGTGPIEPKSIEKLSNLHGSANITIGIHEILKIQAQMPIIPTYLYKFAYESEEPMMQAYFKMNMKGTCHGEDLAYLFLPKALPMIGKKPPTLGSSEHLMVRKFIELWTNFAETGNPTPPACEIISIDWKPINDLTEYNCLYISEDVQMIKEKNILLQIEQHIARLKNQHNDTRVADQINSVPDQSFCNIV